MPTGSTKSGNDYNRPYDCFSPRRFRIRDRYRPCRLANRQIYKREPIDIERFERESEFGGGETNAERVLEFLVENSDKAFRRISTRT